MASVIVGVLVDVIACSDPKPGLAFVILFSSLVNVEGDAVPAATSGRI